MSTLISSVMKGFLEQLKLSRQKLLREPVQVYFEIKYASEMPWAFQIKAAPLTERGDVVEQHDTLDLFWTTPNIWGGRVSEMCVRIQKRVRGGLGRARVAHLRDVAGAMIDHVLAYAERRRVACRAVLRDVANEVVDRSFVRKAVAAHIIDHVLTAAIVHSTTRQAQISHAIDFVLDSVIDRSNQRARVARYCVDELLRRTIEAHHFRDRRARLMQAWVRGRQTRQRRHFDRKR